MWVVLAVFGATGILYFSVFGGTSQVILGITIAFGVGLSICLIRFIASRLEDVGWRGWGKDNRSIEELEYEVSVGRCMDEARQEEKRAKAMARGKAVSSTTQLCRKLDRVHSALVVLYENGTRTVCCGGHCVICEYGDVEYWDD